MQYLNSRLSGLHRRIAEAEEIAQKRHRSIRRAERNLELAENEVYSLCL